MKRFVFFCSVFLGFSCLADESNLSSSKNFPVSQTALGGIGLLEIPTARFSDDGEFTFGISTEEPFHRVYGKVQFFPWLEAVLKYTEGTHKPYNRGSKQTWKDKGIDIKFRLLEEGEFLPQVAVGFNDFGGTAYYASEYIVASKRINDFDLTLGLGWGRFAGGDIRGKGNKSKLNISNPMGWLFDDYNTRGGGTRLGGALNLGRLFSGDSASLFGGIEYYTSIPNLSLKLEYDPTDYSRAIGQEIHFRKKGNKFRHDSRFNFGLNHQFQVFERDKIDLALGFVRGSTFYANVAVHSNLNFIPKSKYLAPQEVLNEPYLKPYPELNTDWQKYLSDLIIWQMGNEGLVTHNIIFNGDELQVEISQSRFRRPIQAIDLASRILGNNSPSNINKITVINIDQGVETLRASIPRQTLVEAVALGPLSEELVEFDVTEALNSDAIVKENEYLYPHFSWSVRPNLTGTIQHQIKFWFWQLEALVHAEYAFMKGLYLSADYGIDVVNNFDDYRWHIADGALHHVRMDRRLYLTEGKSGLRRLAFDYLIDINSNLKAKVSAGYLEWMYGGVGGQIVYMPDDRRWALGVDTYWVKQREFDQKFSFREYETVTGFLTFYYDLPFLDLRFKGKAGKFLGKDVGVLVDVSRRFKNGARVGAMVAQTDCDAACVGEGSFNKWIYFDLPMDLFASNSQSRGKSLYAWSPLTKDAGTQVESGNLYNLMVNSPDEVDALRRTPWSMKKIFSGFSTTPKTKI